MYMRYRGAAIASFVKPLTNKSALSSPPSPPAGLMPSPADPSTEDISNFLRAVQLNDQLMNGGGPSPVPGGQDLNANSMFNRVSSATSLQQLAQQQQQQQQQTIKLAGGPDLGHHFDAGLLGHSGGGYLQGPDPGALDPSLLQTGPISAAQAQSIDPAFHYQLPTSPPLQGQNPPMGMGMGMQGGPYGNGAVPPHMQPPQQHHQPYGSEFLSTYPLSLQQWKHSSVFLNSLL